MKQTLYDVLGVKPDASFEDIQFAYQQRFEKLRVETSFDSNRLVMLSEAREVLTNPERRAAYDASLNPTVQPRVLSEPLSNYDEEQRSLGKWIVAGIAVAVLAGWWLMRDAGPPEDSSQTALIASQVQPAEVTARPEADMATSVDEDGLADEEFREQEAAAQIVPSSEPAAPSVQPTLRETQTTQVPTQVVTAVVSPIVGSWECFDPVSGRTSRYGFGSDGQLNVSESGGDSRRFNYELAGTLVKFVDVEPSQTMAVEELSASKLILNTPGEGRRVVCSR